MKKLLIVLILMPFLAQSQSIISSWTRNVNGKKGSYYAQTGTAQTPVYTFTTSPDSADVLRVCYSNTYVWVKSNGLTDYMGKYANPGYCYSQSYVHTFPRTPTVPTTKTISPKGGAIGLLTNGIPIYGLGNSTSYNGSTNTNMGSGIWNVEVYKSEGFVLDTAFGAHPQQQSAYHTHASPFRLYKYYASTVHSPIIGYAFDGYPVYGPYGYTSALNASSGISRMTTGYALRNITNRTTLPSGANATQTGPAINATYPLGTYCEDYAWAAANGGTLDEYNGRYCVTPEYPSGTYAYFTTVNASGVGQFPYLIGVYYYGAPEITDFTSAGGGTTNTVTLPTSGTTCLYAVLPIELIDFKGFSEKNRNHIAWQTANEWNVKHYIIERSAADSRDAKFENIGIVKSRGNSNDIQNYTFMDDNPLPLAYYRLRSVDDDGQEDLSKIISISNGADKQINVFPTVVKDVVHFTYPPSVKKVKIEIFDMVGKVVLTGETTAELTELNLSYLQKGLYLVAIKADGVNQLVKIVKQ